MGRLSHWFAEHALMVCIVGSLTFWAGLVVAALSLPQT